MKTGVISDTHQNFDYLNKVIEKGHPASYAVIRIEAGKIEIKIIDLNKQTNLLNYQKPI